MTYTKTCDCDINIEDQNSPKYMSSMLSVFLDTGKGKFYEDQSGLLHYLLEWGSVEHSIKDALENLPERAVWFWFNDTPAPIFKGDTPDSLYTRWIGLREGMQKDSSLDSFVYKRLKDLAGLK